MLHPRSPVSVLLVCTAAAAAQDLDAQHAAWVKPWLVEHCMDCHDSETRKGSIDLEALLEVGSARQAAALLPQVAHAVGHEEMPPKKRKVQPTREERDRLVAWINAVQVDEAKAHAGDPGVVVMPRMTREQFQLVVEQFMGVPTLAHAQLPPGSGSGEGFTNIGQSHTMTTNDVDAWMASLRVLMRQALFTPGMPVGWSRTAPPEAVTGADVRKRNVELWGGWFRDEVKAHFERFQGGANGSRAELAQHFAGVMAMEAGATLDQAAATLTATGSPINLRNWHAFLTGPAHANPFLAELQRRWKALPRSGDRKAAAAGFETTVKDLLRDTTFGHRIPKFQKVVSGKEFKIAIDKGAAPFEIDLAAAGAELVLITGQALRPAGDRLQWTGGIVTLEDGSTKPWHEVATLTGAGFSGGTLTTTAPSVVTVTFPAGARRFQVTAAPAPGSADEVCIQAAIDLKAPADLIWLPSIRPIGAKGEQSTAAVLAAHKNANVLLLDTLLDARWNHAATLALFAEAAGRPAPAWESVGIKLSGLNSPSLINPKPIDILQAATPERLAALRDIAARLEASLLPAHYQLAAVLKAKGHRDLQEGAIPAELKTDGWTPAELEMLTTVRQEEGRLLACAKDHLSALARSAWRRMASADEIARLAGIYAGTRAEGLSYEASVGQAALAVFLSPEFLYRLEHVDTASGGKPYPLSGEDLADRLAMTLWSAFPDEALRKALGGAAPPTDAAISGAVSAMVADPRIRGLVRRFAGEWLSFDGFSGFSGPDPKRFREFTPELAAAMEQEAALFFTDLFQQNRPPADVIHGTHTFLDARLAKHYGIAGVDGDGFRRVPWGDSGRAGVLGMGAFLTRYSTPLRTSPVKRGHWAWEQVLGVHMAQPPTVPRISDDERSADGLTIRQQLEKHRSDASCMSCHAKFDPLGIALENFDPIGRWRSKDLAGKPVEASEKTPDGTMLDGPRGLTAWLAQPTQRRTFHTGFIRKLLVYALGRDVLLSDQPLIDALVARAETGAGARDILVGVLTSTQYRQRRDPIEPSK